jgi:hypothetical protein
MASSASESSNRTPGEEEDPEEAEHSTKDTAQERHGFKGDSVACIEAVGLRARKRGGEKDSSPVHGEVL